MMQENRQDNPYAPPPELKPGPIGQAPESPDASLRSSAQLRLWVAIFVLFIAAVFNYICFDLELVNTLPNPTRSVYRATNVAGIALVTSAAIFLLLPLMEMITRIVHSVFSKKHKNVWIAATHTTLRQSPHFAILGAVLWFTWTYCFYISRFDYWQYSPPITIFAVLNCGLFLFFLLFSWFSVERGNRS